MSDEEVDLDEPLDEIALPDPDELTFPCTAQPVTHLERIEVNPDHDDREPIEIARDALNRLSLEGWEQLHASISFEDVYNKKIITVVGSRLECTCGSPSRKRKKKVSGP